MPEAIRGQDIAVGTPTQIPRKDSESKNDKGSGVRASFSADQLAALDMATDALRTWRDTGSAWRDQASRCRRYYNSKQWEDPKEVARLKGESRAPLTINQIAPYVNVTCGMEIQNRGKIIFSPRRPTAEGMNAASELATAVYEWAMDNCNGHDERSRAFMDLCITGMGWTHMRIDVMQDADGKLVSEWVPGDEMAWDAFSCKRNLEDAMWVARRRWVRMSEIKKRWPQHAEAVRASFDVSSLTPMDLPARVVRSSPELYRADGSKHYPSRPPGLGADAVLLTDFQYREIVTKYEVDNPIVQDSPKVQLTKKELNDLEAVTGPIEDTNEIQTYVYKQIMFVGDCILEGGDDESGLLPIQDGFGYQCMTGYYDEEDQVWYGLVPCLIDPQRGWNKYISQAITIWSHSPKGTVFVETDAVTDPVRLPALWSSPAAVIPVTPDSLAKGKIKVEMSPPLSAAAVQLAQIFASGLKLASGMSLDMLGLSEGDQPAQLMRQRQGQGMAILGILFEAARRFRMDEARLVISWVRKFLTDGRTIRVGPLDAPRVIQLWRDPLVSKFDVYVDENPQNPSTKMEYWEAMQPILPVMIRAGIFVPEVLDFAPIPTGVRMSLKQKIGEAMQKQEQMAKQQQGQPGATGPQPKTMQEIQAEIQETLAKAEKAKADAELALARAQAIKIEAQVDTVSTGQQMQLQKDEALAARMQNAIDAIKTVAEIMGLRVETASQARSTQIADRDSSIRNAAEIATMLSERADSHRQSKEEIKQARLTRA